ncbi:phospho-N-acetylmuramoyl-pentapeptide-transferase [Porphyromonas pogonae]|uniref:phospho-N-acetylmuramoyl-pentapeptide- transferase n=1 Tax=Porphyromonas pogonae TaxID=867595 RepID=UPI002E7A05BB|nr:phospho-N-acetylmuramoyl-pentapeptide-transferase [Porphyromonas pogonae]
MLYYLFDLFHAWGIPGARLLHYVSFRVGIAVILALLISTVYGARIIKKLQKLQIGETIRDLGLEGQLSKKGTPTMGGIIIILAILVPTLLFARLDNIYIILMILTTVLLGALGFLDDYIKVYRKNKAGLKGKYKIIGQVGLGFIVGFTLYISPAVVIKENSEIIKEGNERIVKFETVDVKSTKTTIPFLKNNNLDYAKIFPFKGDAATVAGWTLFVLMTIFIVTMISNCVNLTDGIDGLASGSSAIVGIVLAIFAYVSSHIEMAAYLNIMFIPGAEELTIFAASFVGATLGFLWYNSFPAQVFMGDTGSLTLGGIIGVFAIIIRKELLLPILCGVFIVEGISVLLQVGYFKYSKKKTGEGRRIFKMAPLHHHYQKVGGAQCDSLISRPNQPLPETKITVRFLLVGIILAALTVVTLKMR